MADHIPESKQQAGEKWIEKLIHVSIDHLTGGLEVQDSTGLTHVDMCGVGSRLVYDRYGCFRVQVDPNKNKTTFY